MRATITGVSILIKIDAVFMVIVIDSICWEPPPGKCPGGKCPGGWCPMGCPGVGITALPG
ncbi:MAG: hypothetical protein GY938_25845 [Ketobacter sp.]|nr:hypothetical protein [Ketobacter sp.]